MTNKVILIGRIIEDAKVATTNNGITRCGFGIAVNERLKDKERKTNFFNVVAWRGLAESYGKYLKKGKMICVVGSLDNRKYTDSNGVERQISEIIAQEFEFLDSNTNTQETPTEQPVDETLPF